MILSVLLFAIGLLFSCGGGGGSDGPKSEYPDVKILTPKDSAYFRVGESIIFEGKASDPQDGVMGGDDLVWISSIDGELARSDILEINHLSEGNHIITLSVTDSDNHIGNDEITISVNPNEILWTRLVDFEGVDDFYDIFFDSKGDLFVPGVCNDGEFGMIGKFNRDGDQMEKIYKNFIPKVRIHDYKMVNDLIYVLGNRYEVNPSNPSDFFISFYSTIAKTWSAPIFYGSTQFSTSGIAITSDNNQNIYVVGATSGRLKAQPNAGGNDAFIMKLDPNGKELWTVLLGSEQDDVANEIVLDSKGNCYIVGDTSGNIDGDHSGAKDKVVFVAKFSVTNHPPQREWVVQYDAPESSGDVISLKESLGITDIYISGTTKSPFSSEHAIQGEDDVFLSKLDDEYGDVDWTRLLGSVENETVMAIDKSDNIFVTGWAKGYLNGIANDGVTDAYLAIFKPNGDLRKTLPYSSYRGDRSLAINLKEEGYCYLAGSTNGKFNGQVPEEGCDGFVMKNDLSKILN